MTPRSTTRALALLFSLGVLLAAGGTSTAIPPADPVAVANCAVTTESDSEASPIYDGVGPEKCIVKFYDSTGLRNVILVKEVPPVNTYASIGGVRLTLIDGTVVTTVSAALGYENPQCSVWNGKPFVQSCQDSALIPDVYAQEKYGGTVDCLRLAHVGIDADANGQDDFFFPNNAVKVTKGPC